MTTEIMRLDPARALAEKKDWATAMAQANLLPPAYQRQPANLLLAAEYADTLEVPRMAALTGIHVIQGKPTLSADLMTSLVRRAGHKLRLTGDAQSATAVLIRSDDPDFEYRVTWTMEKAQRAGLLSKQGGNWQKYPEAMLRSRAITEVVRMGASEVLFGAIYAPEELGVEVDASGAPVAPAPPTAAPTQAEPSPAEIEQWKEINMLARDLGIDNQTLLKTACYVGQADFVCLDEVPLNVAVSVAKYLEDRLEKERARQQQVSEATDEEVLDAEIVEEELPIEGGQA